MSRFGLVVRGREGVTAGVLPVLPDGPDYLVPLDGYLVVTRPLRSSGITTGDYCLTTQRKGHRPSGFL